MINSLSLWWWRVSLSCWEYSACWLLSRPASTWWRWRRGRWVAGPTTRSPSRVRSASSRRWDARCGWGLWHDHSLRQVAQYTPCQPACKGKRCTPKVRSAFLTDYREDLSGRISGVSRTDVWTRKELPRYSIAVFGDRTSEARSWTENIKTF